MTFDFPLGWPKAGKPLDPVEYIDASVTELFYTNNEIHDLFYTCKEIIIYIFKIVANVPSPFFQMVSMKFLEVSNTDLILEAGTDDIFLFFLSS